MNGLFFLCAGGAIVAALYQAMDSNRTSDPARWWRIRPFLPLVLIAAAVMVVFAQRYR
jgi:hypothetical protein